MPSISVLIMFSICLATLCGHVTKFCPKRCSQKWVGVFMGCVVKGGKLSSLVSFLYLASWKLDMVTSL